MNISAEKVYSLYRDITETLIGKGLTVTTMESCTAGQIASLITDTDGSSAVIKGAFVTYSNEAKVRQGVPAKVIERYGVYSEQTAAAMAEACRRAYTADFGLGITGTLGRPDPANPDSVSGEVYYAVASPEGTESFGVDLPPLPDRRSCKLMAATAAGERLFAAIERTGT